MDATFRQQQIFRNPWFYFVLGLWLEWVAGIDLRDVTKARWQTESPGRFGSLLLRTRTSARVEICFETYERQKYIQIIRRLRSVLPPEIQTGWNLFAYKIAFRKTRSIHSDPDRMRFLNFLLIWTFIGIGSVILIQAIETHLAYPDQTRSVVGIVWLAILLFQAVRQDRLISRRDSEAADLAAQARAEAGIDL
jgi:hypothetical protein